MTGDYSSGQIGGAEIQQAQIAKALVRRGVDVSVITEDYGQTNGERCKGVIIYKSYRPGSGLPFIRFFYPKITSIYRALAEAKADIYYVRTASFLTAVVSFYCNRHGKRWVYAGAHDTDFIPGKELVPNFRDRWLYQYGLNQADKIIVQSDKQKSLVDRCYQQGSVLVRNFLDVEPRERKLPGNPVVLWVSTMRRWKRPELFLEMAGRLPEYRFTMVGGPDLLDSDYYLDMKRKAETMANVDFLGFQPPSATEKLFDGASVFVNTSEHEGFPNTFLQAWLRGLPVVTFFDPDNVVTRHGLGRKIDSVNDAVSVIPELVPEDTGRSQRIRRYFSSHHSAGIINRYIELFEGLL